MTIISKPSTDDYRAGWDRVFGSKKGDNDDACFVPCEEYGGSTSRRAGSNWHAEMEKAEEQL